MQVDRGVGADRGRFARYPALTFSMMPTGLVEKLVESRVGRNGWAVMVVLCRMVFADGGLGRVSAEEVSRVSGLSAYQVARGMKELRDKGVIVPVMRRTAKGYRHPDRSNFGHVARYCICRDVWERVETAGDACGVDGRGD